MEKSILDLAMKQIRSEDRHGLVYFAGNSTSGPVKIGFTSNADPGRRLAGLQTASPVELKILGCIEGTNRTERAIHRFLHKHWVRGEWFDREASLAILEHLTPLDSLFIPTGLFHEQFAAIAFEVGENHVTERVLKGLDDEPLAVTIARHVLMDLLRSFCNTRAYTPLPLFTWLTLQCERDDAIGDLARDAKSDEANFPWVACLTDYLGYIIDVSGGNQAVTRTMIDAWIECQQDIVMLPSRTR